MSVFQLNTAQPRLCETIHECRCLLGMSEEELAEKIHQTPTFVRKLENTEIDLRASTLILCAEAFDISVTELLELAEGRLVLVALGDDERLNSKCETRKKLKERDPW